MFADFSMVLSIGYLALSKMINSIRFIETEVCDGSRWTSTLWTIEYSSDLFFVIKQVVSFVRKLEQQNFQFTRYSTDGVQKWVSISSQSLFFHQWSTWVHFNANEENFDVKCRNGSIRTFSSWQTVWQYLQTCTGGSRFARSPTDEEDNESPLRRFYQLIFRCLPGKNGSNRYAIHPAESTGESEDITEKYKKGTNHAISPSTLPVFSYREISANLRSQVQRECLLVDAVSYLKQLRQLQCAEHDLADDFVNEQSKLMRHILERITHPNGDLPNFPNRDICQRDQLPVQDLAFLLAFIRKNYNETSQMLLVQAILRNQLECEVQFPGETSKLLVKLLDGCTSYLHANYETECALAAWLAAKVPTETVHLLLEQYPLVNVSVSLLDGISSRIRCLSSISPESPSQREQTVRVLLPYMNLFRLCVVSISRLAQGAVVDTKRTLVHSFITSVQEILRVWFQNSRHYSLINAGGSVPKLPDKEAGVPASGSPPSSATATFRAFRAQSERCLMRKDRSISQEREHSTEWKSPLSTIPSVGPKEKEFESKEEAFGKDIVESKNRGANTVASLSVVTDVAPAAADSWEQSRTVPMLDLSNLYTAEPVTQSVRMRGVSHSNRSRPSSVAESYSGSSAEGEVAFGATYRGVSSTRRRKSLPDMSNLSRANLQSQQGMQRDEITEADNCKCKALGRLFGQRYVSRFSSALSYFHYLEREEGLNFEGTKTKNSSTTKKPWHTPLETPNQIQREITKPNVSNSGIRLSTPLYGWAWSIGRTNDDDKQTEDILNNWTASVEAFVGCFDDFAEDNPVNDEDLGFKMLSTFEAVISNSIELYQSTSSLKTACVFKRASLEMTVPCLRLGIKEGRASSRSNLHIVFPTEYFWSAYFESTRRMLESLGDGYPIDKVLGEWKHSLESLSTLFGRLRDIYCSASETACINHFNRFLLSSIHTLCKKCATMSANSVYEETNDAIKLWMCGCYSGLAASAQIACFITDEGRRMKAIQDIQEIYTRVVTTSNNWISSCCSLRSYLVVPTFFIGYLLITLSQQTCFTDALNEEVVDDSKVRSAAGTVAETVFSLGSLIDRTYDCLDDSEIFKVMALFHNLECATLNARKTLPICLFPKCNVISDPASAVERQSIQAHDVWFKKLYMGIQRSLLEGKQFLEADIRILHECAWHISSMGAAIESSAAVSRFVNSDVDDEEASQDSSPQRSFQHSSWYRIERDTALLLKYLGIVSFISLELGLEARFHERWLTRRLTVPERSTHSSETKKRDENGSLLYRQQAASFDSPCYSIDETEDKESTGNHMPEPSKDDNMAMDAQQNENQQGVSEFGKEDNDEQSETVVSLKDTLNLSPLSEREELGEERGEADVEQQQVRVIDFTKSLSGSHYSLDSSDSEDEESSEQYEIGAHLEQLHEMQAKSNVVHRDDQQQPRQEEETATKAVVPSLAVETSLSLDISGDKSLSYCHSDNDLENKHLDRAGDAIQESDEENKDQHHQMQENNNICGRKETTGGDSEFALADEPLGPKDDEHADENFHVPPLERSGSEINLGVPLDTAMTGTSILDWKRQYSSNLLQMNNFRSTKDLADQPLPTVLTSTKVWFSFSASLAKAEKQQTETEEEHFQNEYVQKHAKRLRNKYLYAKSLCPLFRWPDLHASCVLLLLQCVLDGTGVACRPQFARRFPNQDDQDSSSELDEMTATQTSHVWCALSSMFGTPTNSSSQTPSGYSLQRVQHIVPPSNVLYILHHHLNHPTNLHLMDLLHEGAKQRGNHLLRLLRLLSSSLFSPSKYELMDYISSGAYGRVCKARIKEDEKGSEAFPLAVKQLKLPVGPYDKCLLADLVTEVAISEDLTAQYLRETSGIPPPVVRLLDYGVTEEYYWLVMEECTTTLATWRRRLGRMRIAHQRSLSRKDTTAHLQRLASEQYLGRERSDSVMESNSKGRESTDKLSIAIPLTRMRSTSAIDSPSKRKSYRNRGRPRVMTEVDIQEKLNNGLCLADLPLLLSIFREIVLGVDFLHRSGVTHFDIKADNILMRSDPVHLPHFEEAEDSEEEEEEEAKSLFYASRESPVAANRQRSSGFQLDELDYSACEDGRFSSRGSIIEPLVHSHDLMSQLRGIMCLSDFGESMYIPGTHAWDTVTNRPRGTDCIRSPEMLKIGGDGAVPYNGQWTSSYRGEIRGSHDVWSLGCLLYEILTSNQLFAEECEHEWVSFFVHVTDDKVDVLDNSQLNALRPITEVPNPLDPDKTLEDPFGIIDLFHLLLMRNPRRRPSLSFVVTKIEEAILSYRDLVEQQGSNVGEYNWGGTSIFNDRTSARSRDDQKIPQAPVHQPIKPSPLVRSTRVQSSV